MSPSRCTEKWVASCPSVMRVLMSCDVRQPTGRSRVNLTGQDCREGFTVILLPLSPCFLFLLCASYTVGDGQLFVYVCQFCVIVYGIFFPIPIVFSIALWHNFPCFDCIHEQNFKPFERFNFYRRATDFVWRLCWEESAINFMFF